MDRFKKATRSKIMSAIRSTGNKSTEWRFRAALVSSGICGWKMHLKELPGNPDFVFKKEKLVVFVDGCFWHGCPKCYRRPFSSRKYWDSKLNKNKKRDILKNKNLISLGWSVLRFWEHEVLDSPKRCIKNILDHIQ